jgi:hypothetical protein
MKIMGHYRNPFKVLPGIDEKDLEKTISALKDEGYVVIQKKPVQDKDGTRWDLKAKLDEPPAKPGRELVD